MIAIGRSRPELFGPENVPLRTEPGKRCQPLAKAQRLSLDCPLPGARENMGATGALFENRSSGLCARKHGER